MMRIATRCALILGVTVTAYAGVPAADFSGFAKSADQFEDHATASYSQLHDLHRRYVVATATDGPLTVDSFPDVSASEQGLAAQYQLRDDAVQVLASYAGLLGTLAQNATTDAVQAAAQKLRSDVSTLQNDGHALTDSTEVASVGAAGDLADRVRVEGLSPAQIDAAIVKNVTRTERVLHLLASSKIAAVAGKHEPFELAVAATGLDEVLRLVELHKHDEALLSLLRVMQPDVDRLTSFIAESSDSMNESKDLMMTRILSRENGVRPAYATPERLDFDTAMSSMLAANRALGPLLGSVGAAATHYAKAHAELLQVATGKQTARASLGALEQEVKHGRRFFSAMKAETAPRPPAHR